MPSIPRSQIDAKEETQSRKVITAQKTLQVRVVIFTKSLKQMEDTLGMIEDDLLTVIKHYEKENTKGEIEVHPLPDHLCSFCGERWTNCKCGRPHKRPAV